jgi:hypothetical protein
MRCCPSTANRVKESDPRNDLSSTRRSPRCTRRFRGRLLPLRRPSLPDQDRSLDIGSLFLRVAQPHLREFNLLRSTSSRLCPYASLLRRRSRFAELLRRLLRRICISLRRCGGHSRGRTKDGGYPASRSTMSPRPPQPRDGDNVPSVLSYVSPRFLRAYPALREVRASSIPY